MSARLLVAWFLAWTFASCGHSTQEPAASSAPTSETTGGPTASPTRAPEPSTAPEGPSGPSPEACAAVAGRCVGVGECGASVGHLHLDVRCGPSPSIACCIMPADSCGGREDFECTDGSATYRPGCRNGRLECPSGTRRGERPSAGGPPS